MASFQRHRIQTDTQGNILVPPEIAKRFGLIPDTELLLEERENELVVSRPVTMLSKVYIEPTSKCNLSCRACIRNAWEEPAGKMAKTTFTSVLQGIEDFDPRPSLFFGGFGEPLSHPAIIDMVARAKKVSPKVDLITNGMLLNEKLSRGLILAGLDTLWVSIDGATPASYPDVRIGAALPKILENIENHRYRHFDFTGKEADIGLAFVAMKQNIADLPALVKMSTKLGISRYVVTNVLPYTQEMCDEVLFQRSLDMLISLPSPWVPDFDFPRMDANLHTSATLTQLMSINSHNYLSQQNWTNDINYCPFVRSGTTVIAWDGSVSPCLPLVHQHVSYLRHIKRAVHRYVVGNIKEKNLKAIWESPGYMEIRRRVNEFDYSPCTVCASCELVESNEEDCYANIFPTCGGCLWAQGYIRCP